ncbi:hypothetical protein ACHAWC_009547, partial [Mediolabrus comicus]
MGKFLKIAVGGVAVAAIAIGVGVGVGVRNKNQEKNSTAAANTNENYDKCRRLLVVPGVEDSFTYEAPSVRRKVLARSLGEETSEAAMMPAKPSNYNDDGAWGSPYGPASVASTSKGSSPKGSSKPKGSSPASYSTPKGSSSKNGSPASYSTKAPKGSSSKQQLLPAYCYQKKPDKCQTNPYKPPSSGKSSNKGPSNYKPEGSGKSSTKGSNNYKPDGSWGGPSSYAGGKSSS